MDTPTLVGTGFVVLGAVVWVVCAIYAWRIAPTFGRSRGAWTVAAIILGPIALMILYVLPEGHHVSDKGRGARPGHAGSTKDHQAELYEVPKKHK